ncbi:hypothetical protein IMZ48_09595 [Candidatus Bathyarchaeota archaeon]|nr:hypothetical protein [Candidatus Bathyarchaeota archaeon]
MVCRVDVDSFEKGETDSLCSGFLEAGPRAGAAAPATTGGDGLVCKVEVDSFEKGKINSLAAEAETDVGGGALYEAADPVEETDELGVCRPWYDAFLGLEANDSMLASDEDDEAMPE